MGAVRFCNYLMSFSFPFSSDECAIIGTTYRWPAQINDMLKLSVGAAEMFAEKQLQVLFLRQRELEGDIRSVGAEIRSMRRRGGVFSPFQARRQL